jgi:hypothetical protein
LDVWPDRHEGLWTTEAAWKLSAPRVQHNIDPPDRARIDFRDLAKGQSTLRIAQQTRFHTASTLCSRWDLSKADEVS